MGTHRFICLLRCSKVAGSSNVAFVESISLFANMELVGQVICHLEAFGIHSSEALRAAIHWCAVQMYRQ